MPKYIFFLFVLTINLFPQTLILKAEYKAEREGLLPDINVVKNPSDEKIYVVAREAINKQLYIVLYDNSFKRLANLRVTPSVSVDNSFIRDGKLYFSDKELKYIELSDYKIGVVNKDRKEISNYSLEKLNGKEVILANNDDRWVLYDISSNKEILNIKIKSTENNRGKATIYNNNIYYTSEGNEISRYEVKSNSVIWSVKFPDKPVRILGIKLSSAPNNINCINTFRKNNIEQIGIITSFGDYFVINAADGKSIINDIQYDKFRSMSQNNSKMFVNDYLFKDKKTNSLLIYAASIDKSVYCLNAKDFSSVWETETGNQIYMPLSILDINNDGYPEVFGVNDYDNNLFVLDGKTGKKLIFQSIKEGKKFNQTKVYLVDFYGTGTLNLIVQVNNEKVKVFEMPSVKVPKNYLFTNKNIY